MRDERIGMPANGWFGAAGLPSFDADAGIDKRADEIPRIPILTRGDIHQFSVVIEEKMKKEVVAFVGECVDDSPLDVDFLPKVCPVEGLPNADLRRIDGGNQTGAKDKR